MAMYSELPVVLDYIRSQTEVYYQVQKDKVADNLYGSDLDQALSYSTSLDGAEKAWRTRQLEMEFADSDQKEENKQEEKKSDLKDVERKENIKEKNRADTSGWFNRQRVEQNGLEAPSALTALLAVEKENDERMLEITIHVPNGPPFVVKVAEDAIIRDALTEVVKASLKQRRQPPLRQPVELAYHIFIAEQGGQADTALPVSLRTFVRKLGKSFALVENQAFEKEDKLRERKGTEVARVSRPLIAIHLPNELKTLVPYQADLKISQLLIKICFKRGLDAQTHYFTLPNSSSPIDEKTVLEALNSKELYLRLKRDASDVGDEVMTYSDNYTYTVSVSRGNRYPKEISILSISTSGLSLEKKKRGKRTKPKYSWNEVVRVGPGERNKQIFLEFSSGGVCVETETDSEIIQVCNRYKSES